MNAILTIASAADQLQRYDAIRRRNAEQAYHRQAEYNGRNQKMLDELEALLTGKKPDAALERSDSKKLESGQMKQASLPLSKTMEETKVALQRLEQSHIEVDRAQVEALKVASMDLSNNLERELRLEQKRFAKAISAYSIQVEAKRNGFSADWSSYSKIA